MPQSPNLGLPAQSIQVASLFGMRVARLTRSETVLTLQQWMSESQPCRYVVTPNVDHVVKLHSRLDLREAYSGAALAVADGWPLVTASRLLGEPLPERVAGSDLVPQLLAECSTIADFRVYFLGGAPGVAERAAKKIRDRWPHVTICGCASPPRNFETDAAINDSVVREINRAEPHLLVVGLGAPRQEIWLHKNSPRLNARVAIAAGATIDFLAGAQTRAPVWVQRLYLEWLFRLLTDSKRLTGRYVRDAIVFPQLVFAEWRRVALQRRS